MRIEAKLSVSSPADGDQAVDTQRLEIFDHDRSEIVIFAVEAKLFQALAREVLGNFRFSHAPRIGAGGVEDGAACSIDPERVLAGEFAGIGRIGEMIGVEVGEPFPSRANADHAASNLASRGRVTDLITEFSPGTSPPPVRIPILFALRHRSPPYRSVFEPDDRSNPARGKGNPTIGIPQ